MTTATLRQTFDYEMNKAMCKIWDGTYVSFAVIRHKGRNRLIPGTNIADALVNFSKFRKVH